MDRMQISDSGSGLRAWIQGSDSGVGTGVVSWIWLRDRTQESDRGIVLRTRTYGSDPGSASGFRLRDRFKRLLKISRMRIQ